MTTYPAIRDLERKRARATTIVRPDKVARAMGDLGIPATDDRQVVLVIWPRRDWAEEFAAANRDIHGHDVEVLDHPQGAVEVIRLNMPPDSAAVRA